MTISFANNRDGLYDAANAIMDYIQTHDYSHTDMGSLGPEDVAYMKSLYPNKPAFIGEFGIPNVNNYTAVDPTGLNIHNQCWGSTMAKAAAGGFTWWWDNYVDPDNLYFNWQGLSKFLQGEELDAYGYASVALPISTAFKAPFTITPGYGWGKSPSAHFWVSSNGTITPSPTGLSSYIYGSQDNTQYRNPPGFYITADVPSYFQFSVVGISAAAGIAATVTLDGKVIVNNSAVIVGTFQFLFSWYYSFCKFAHVLLLGQFFNISLSAGFHNVTIDGTGTDWYQISDIVLTNYVPSIRGRALVSSQRVLGWVIESILLPVCVVIFKNRFNPYTMNTTTSMPDINKLPLQMVLCPWE